MKGLVIIEQTAIHHRVKPDREDFAEIAISHCDEIMIPLYNR